MYQHKRLFGIYGWDLIANIMDKLRALGEHDMLSSKFETHDEILDLIEYIDESLETVTDEV